MYIAKFEASAPLNNLSKLMTLLLKTEFKSSLSVAPTWNIIAITAKF